MEIKTDRYCINIEEIAEGGPGGYESVYLMSEGDPARDDLYSLLDNFQGDLLPAKNKVIRQRNGQVLVSTLKEDRPFAIVSGFKPSGAYHFGHKLTSSAVAFFQKNGGQAFVPVADIECEMDKKLTREQYQYWAADNLLDWGANGVNLDAAHVYLQSEEFRVNALSYIVARSLKFKFATDIYGAEKMIEDFPFLFAGITQVGDILLPQHRDFGNNHSFMVSGQDQDGHMKMTVTLTDATFKSGIDMLGVETIPSGFYIPHIRGISGDKASSSKAEGTIYLGSGPTNEGLTDRIKGSQRKLDKAKADHLEKCALDMVRYIDCFNRNNTVPFEKLVEHPKYREMQSALGVAVSREEQEVAQGEIDTFMINACKDYSQDNVEIIRDTLAAALTEHQQKRADVLQYAQSKSSSQVSLPLPGFWAVPDRAVVAAEKRNATQWFDLIANASAQIIP